MICVYCRNTETAVINSRPHKRTPSVWRRRQCPSCHATFTTDEAARAILVVTGQSPKSPPALFNIGRLTISIWRSFLHDTDKGRLAAGDLAQTIASKLTARQAISAIELARIVHETLRHYDSGAAIAYALQHKLPVTAKSRRPKRSSDASYVADADA